MVLLRGADEGWRNWSGNQRCEPATIHRPTTVAEIQSVVERAAGSDRSLRVAGAGHSFSPVVPTEDVLVSLEEHTGLVSVDREARRATVRGGTPLWALAAEGLALAVLGDVDRQSVAGAMATGTHGTGREFGVLPTQLAGLTLVTADGTRVELGPGDGTAFRAAQVSLGALGIIESVTLDLAAAYRLRQRRFTLPLETCLERFERLQERHRHVEFFWFPHTDAALVKVIDETDDPSSGGTRLDAVGERLANLAWAGLCRLGTRFPSTASHGAAIAAATLDADETVGPSHEVFANARDVRFNEMEYGVPLERGAEAVRAIRAVADEHPEIQFPIEVRVVAGDETLLSPAAGRDSLFIAVHAYHRKPYRPYFEDCERVFDRFDGRPHWGKVHTKDATSLAKRYPDWDRFQQIRREFDPDGLFLNDHLRDLFGVT